MAPVQGNPALSYDEMDAVIEDTRTRLGCRVFCVALIFAFLFVLFMVLGIVVNLLLLIGVGIALILGIAWLCWGALYVDKKCQKLIEQRDANLTAIAHPRPERNLADTQSMTADEQTDTTRDQTKDGFTNDTFSGVPDERRLSPGDGNSAVLPSSDGSPPFPTVAPPSYEEVMEEQR